MAEVTRDLLHQPDIPYFAEKGEKTTGFWVDLELKLVADVGLVGYPNTGNPL